MSGENLTEVMVGGAVVAVAAGFLIYAAQSVGLGPQPGSYELRAAFPSAEGIRPGTDVRLAGVKVGSVTRLELNPQTYMAEARFTVQDGIDLPDDSAAVIASEGLLGGNFLQLLPGGSSFNLEPGAEVQDTQGAISVTTLLMKFVGGAGGEDAAE